MDDNCKLSSPDLLPVTFSAPAADVVHAPLAEVTRGAIVESTHRGSVAVCAHDGELLFAAGDPAFMTFTRSALKPLQALPFVVSGGVERFGYTPPQVAMLCAAVVDPDYGHAPRQLADAMTAHPEMISGEHGADLALARAGRGDWVSKIGAEGVRAMSIRSRGWGIAIKVADGNMRGLHVATVGVLDQLGLLDATARAALARMATPELRNLRGIPTGQIRSAVVLDKITCHRGSQVTRVAQ